MSNLKSQRTILFGNRIERVGKSICLLVFYPQSKNRWYNHARFPHIQSTLIIDLLIHIHEGREWLTWYSLFAAPEVGLWKEPKYSFGVNDIDCNGKNTSTSNTRSKVEYRLRDLGWRSVIVNIGSPAGRSIVKGGSQQSLEMVCFSCNAVAVPSVSYYLQEMIVFDLQHCLLPL